MNSWPQSTDNSCRLRCSKDGSTESFSYPKVNFLWAFIRKDVRIEHFWFDGIRFWRWLRVFGRIQGRWPVLSGWIWVLLERMYVVWVVVVIHDGGWWKRLDLIEGLFLKGLACGSSRSLVGAVGGQVIRLAADVASCWFGQHINLNIITAYWSWKARVFLAR